MLLQQVVLPTLHSTLHAPAADINRYISLCCLVKPQQCVKDNRAAQQRGTPQDGLSQEATAVTAAVSPNTEDRASYRGRVNLLEYRLAFRRHGDHTGSPNNKLTIHHHGNNAANRPGDQPVARSVNNVAHLTSTAGTLEAGLSDAVDTGRALTLNQYTWQFKVQRWVAGVSPIGRFCRLSTF